MGDIRQRTLDIIDSTLSSDEEEDNDSCSSLCGSVDRHEDDDLIITLKMEGFKLKVSQKCLNKDKNLLKWVQDKLVISKPI